MFLSKIKKNALQNDQAVGGGRSARSLPGEKNDGGAILKCGNLRSNQNWFLYEID